MLKMSFTNSQEPNQGTETEKTWTKTTDFTYIVRSLPIKLT